MLVSWIDDSAGFFFTDNLSCSRKPAWAGF